MSILETRYLYCDSHGTVHTFKAGEKVWCSAAQDAGLDLRYVSHMQEYAGWSDEESLQYAREYCKGLGLWLYTP